MQAWNENHARGAGQCMPLSAQEHALREQLQVVGQGRTPDSSVQYIAESIDGVFAPTVSVRARIDLAFVTDITSDRNDRTRHKRERVVAADVHAAHETPQPARRDVAEAAALRNRAAREFRVPASEPRKQ